MFQTAKSSLHALANLKRDCLVCLEAAQALKRGAKEHSWKILEGSDIIRSHEACQQKDNLMLIRMVALWL